MVKRQASGPGQWVLLSYRIPREPSTPRIAVWRKLKRLGIGQIGDGVMALPADARTREQLEWIAEEIVEAGGSSSIRIARPATLAAERELATGMARARAAEYLANIAEATAAPADITERQSLARRLRADLRRISRRDYFPPVEREQAVALIDTLATTTEHSRRRVHETFLESDPGATTVAAVAHRWDFGNLGRLAAAYAARYGERPAMTLRRQRSTPRSPARPAGSAR